MLFADARPGRAVHGDLRLAVHACAVIADAAALHRAESARRRRRRRHGCFGFRLPTTVPFEPDVTLWSARSGRRSVLSARDNVTSMLPEKRQQVDGSGSQTFASSMPGRLASRPDLFRSPKATYWSSFGEHGGLAGDRIAHHAEAVLVDDDEGEEAVEVDQRGFQRLPEIEALGDAVGNVGGGHLGVVLGSKVMPSRLARGAVVVVGQRSRWWTRHWLPPCGESDARPSW